MTIRGLGVAAVFLAGCAVGGVSSQLVVRKATAQQAATLTKWEYMCGGSPAETFHAYANNAGLQNWELVSLEVNGGVNVMSCFKRPKL